MNKKNKGANVKPFMVKQYLSVFINCMIENPAFESQARTPGCTQAGHECWPAACLLHSCMRHAVIRLSRQLFHTRSSCSMLHCKSTQVLAQL